MAKKKKSKNTTSTTTNEPQETTSTTTETSSTSENVESQQVVVEPTTETSSHSSEVNVDQQESEQQEPEIVAASSSEQESNQVPSSTIEEVSSVVVDSPPASEQEETNISVNNNTPSSATTTESTDSHQVTSSSNNEELLKSLTDTIQNHCNLMSDEFTSFTDKFSQKVQTCENSITKSKENSGRLSSSIAQQKKEDSQKGTLLDPTVQQMIMGFMTQIDQLYEQRDMAITEKMSKMGTNLQKISKTVKVYENVKKKEKDPEDQKAETTNEEVSSNAQPSDKVESSSNADANVSEEDIRKKCAEFEKLYKEKENELNTFKTKVTDWKEKVKVISNKDMKKIEELKKQVSTLEKTIEELNKKTEEGNKSAEFNSSLQQELKTKDESIEKLNKQIEELKLQISQNDKQLKESDEKISDQKKTIEEKDKLYTDLCETVKNTPPVVSEPVKKSYKDIKILKKILIDGVLWFYFQYTDEEKTNLEWMQHDLLKEVYSQQSQTESFDTLVPGKSIIEELEENFQTKLSELTNKYDEQVKLLNDKDEELKTYKTRAHAALKKKTDALNQAKVDYETQITQLNEAVTKKQEEHEESTKLVQDLQDQVQSLLEIQEKAVKLGGELDRVNSEKDDLEDRIRSLEKKIERSKEEFNQEKANIIQEYEASMKTLENKNDELDDQFRKELRISRERSRRILDDKEREITKLQMKISESKQQFEEAESLKEKNVSLENEITILKDENQSLRNQITDLMNNALDSPSSSRTPRKIDQSQILENALSGEEPSTPSKEEQSPTTSTPALERDFNQLVELANIQAGRDNEVNHYKETINKLKEIIKDRESSEKSFRELEKQLKEEIEHLHRLQKRGDPNLEYLKNILYSFLTSDEKIVREKLLKVIGQLLDLKEEEMDKIAQKVFVETSPSIWGIFGNKK
ncbi:hypothetical protein NAEGRDRAFT_78174 [Naegleria gruberi]|uniref:GRIP domain-containing protein n=1 Tax=Naegleria gruberi TaxID=5762 RepID=D2V1S5_NAEGR|nr:uncharacterized protein NAEGRDRAFT_78174 [Naegleria gruberi]EFC49362.1 hypothetical protein NAEGRDRAFT_78174 [Naegleria gruberi]|eukprot:XP_002682106.1 hypothetical protein NAEGRDRAFT_78174 [Naegleria gruberi strain NEG-M]